MTLILSQVDSVNHIPFFVPHFCVLSIMIFYGLCYPFGLSPLLAANPYSYDLPWCAATCTVLYFPSRQYCILNLFVNGLVIKAYLVPIYSLVLSVGIPKTVMAVTLWRRMSTVEVCFGFTSKVNVKKTNNLLIAIYTSSPSSLSV